MKIITDTREKMNSHILAEFSKQNIPFIVKGLKTGDYSFIKDGISYQDKCIIEKKSSLTELSGSLTTGRARFEKEFIRAVEVGAKIYLLIEDAQGKEKMLLRRELDKDLTLTPEQRQKKTWRSNLSANSMIGSLAKWKERYGFEIIFCDKKQTGKVILDIFEKYLEDEKENEL